MRRGNLKIRIIIGLCIAAYFGFKYCSSQEINPYTGKKQAISMTVDEEIQMGLQSRDQMAAQHGGLYPNESYQALVDNVGNKLVQNSIARETPYRYEFHLSGGMKFETRVRVLGGTRDETDGRRFAQRNAMMFDGLASIASIIDVNGDGKLDLVVARTNPAGFLGRSITVRYAVYLQRADDLFPEQPSFELSHAIPSDTLTERDLRVGRLPPAFDLSRDYDGDGVADLLLVTAGQGFEIRRGKVERRSHEERVWDVLQFASDPWASGELDATFRFAVAQVGSGAHRFLVFGRPEGLHAVGLP